MKIKNYLSRTLHYILHGIPTYETKAVIESLPPNRWLEGRTALITGATSGIGFAIAEAFLKSGAIIVITGRDEGRLNQAIERLSIINPTKTVIYSTVLDNLSVDQFDEKIRHIQNRLGDNKIDILVNNAGVLGGCIANTTVEEYDNVMNTNLRATFFLSQIIGRYMKENNIHGNILNIASSSSLRPADSAYALSKWGIRALTIGLAKSFIQHGIVVNGIAPGPTATPMLLKNGVDNIVNMRNPSKRYALPEEIANMAVILVSNMGRMVVGDVVYMTGGAGTVTYDDVQYIF